MLRGMSLSNASKSQAITATGQSLRTTLLLAMVVSLQGCSLGEKNTPAAAATSTVQDYVPSEADLILEEEAAIRAARPRVVVYDGNDSDSSPRQYSRGGWAPVDSELSAAGFEVDSIR